MVEVTCAFNSEPHEQDNYCLDAEEYRGPRTVPNDPRAELRYKPAQLDAATVASLIFLGVFAAAGYTVVHFTRAAWRFVHGR